MLKDVVQVLFKINIQNKNYFKTISALTTKYIDENKTRCS